MPAPDAPKPTAFAPGKVMLIGEYAVLRHAPAIVIAVSRGATAHQTQHAEAHAHERTTPLTRCIGDETHPITAGDAFETHRHLDATASITLDVTPLYAPLLAPHIANAPPKKLGLGSSAAEAAAIAVLLDPRFQNDALTFDDVEHLRALATPANNPDGSGADFVASLLGGTHTLTRHADKPPTRARLKDPDIALALVYTGTPAITRHHVAAFYQLDAHGPTSQQPASRDLLAARTALIDAAHASATLAANNDWLNAIATYAAPFERFLRALNTSAWLPVFDDIAHLTHQHHGISKPAGAGGGDCMLAAFDRTTRRDAFLAAAQAHGYFAFALTVETKGARLVSHEARA